MVTKPVNSLTEELQRTVNRLLRVLRSYGRGGVMGYNPGGPESLRGPRTCMGSKIISRCITVLKKKKIENNGLGDIIIQSD